jgi:hypothetical protein
MSANELNELRQKAINALRALAQVETDEDISAFAQYGVSDLEEFVIDANTPWATKQYETLAS